MCIRDRLRLGINRLHVEENHVQNEPLRSTTFHSEYEFGKKNDVCKYSTFCIAVICIFIIIKFSMCIVPLT